MRSLLKVIAPVLVVALTVEAATMLLHPDLPLVVALVLDLALMFWAGFLVGREFPWSLAKAAAGGIIVHVVTSAARLPWFLGLDPPPGAVTGAVLASTMIALPFAVVAWLGGLIGRRQSTTQPAL